MGPRGIDCADEPSRREAERCPPLWRYPNGF